MPRNASDFRIVDRKLYEAFNLMPERNRMVRAMWCWIGGKSIGIEHERPSRFGGKSTFNSFHTAAFAVRGILASSYTPLKIMPLCGVSLALLSFGLFVFYGIRAFAHGVPFDGFGTIVALLLFLFGSLFLFLGILSEYVGMIYEEVRRRPTYVVAAKHGLGSPNGSNRRTAKPLPTESAFADTLCEAGHAVLGA